MMKGFIAHLKILPGVCSLLQKTHDFHEDEQDWEESYNTIACN